MTLQDWLTEQGVSDADFAKRIGVKRQTIHRYKVGRRIPRKEILEKIIRGTSGAVKADDFVQIRSEAIYESR